MKKLICSVLICLVVSFSFPVAAYATDYGNYCSDEVVYPSADVPDFSGYITNLSCINFLVYNSLDSCYYLFYSYPYGNSYNMSISYNGLNLYCYLSKGNIRVCKYDPANSNTWVQTVSDYANLSGSSKNLFAVSANFKYKYLWCSSDFTFTDNNVVYTVTNQNSNLSSTDIYANFFDTTGVYLDNDPAVSGGSGGSGEGSVDLTDTNNLLSSIGNKLDSISSDISDLGTDLLTPIYNKVNSIDSTLSSMITTYISPIKTAIDNVNTSLGSLGTNSSSIISHLTTIEGKLDTYLYGLVYGANTNNTTSLYGLATQMKSELTNIKNVLTDFSNNFAYRTTNADFVNSFFADLYDLFMVDDEFNYFTNLDNLLNPYLVAIQNCILYGNAEGEPSQEPNQNIQAAQNVASTVDSTLEDASDNLDGFADGCADYITTFSAFYNGITGISVGVTAIFNFAIGVIIIKKLIGR